MTDQVSVWRRAITWPYTRQGSFVLTFVVLLMGIAAIVGSIQFGNLTELISGVFLLTIVAVDWVKRYRHRHDPAWPPRPKWAIQHESASSCE